MFRNLICLLLSYALVFQASFALEVNGELKNAVGEKLSSDPVTGLVEGRIYYNTTTNTLRVYDGSAWRNKVDTDSTQTLTNKTIDGNDNTLNVLAPTQLEGFVPIANGGTGQSSKAAAYDALSPNGSQGDLTYRGVSSNVALPVGANGQVLTVAGGYPSWADSTGGAGSGEKNYVTNPSAATNITGWTCVGDLAVVRTTTAADLPRENTTPSGIKITADADTQSVADYCYFDFTLDDIDLNRKLNVKFATKQTGSYVSNDLAVVITTQADRTTAVATPVVTNIAAADYDFNGNGFDTASTTTLSLVIRATADMATSAGITISDVVVGPGTIISAAPIGNWQSYTPTVSNLGAGSGTSTGSYRQVGDSAEFQIEFTKDATPGSGTNPVSFSLPSGLTINTAALPGGSQSNDVLGVYLTDNINTSGQYITASVITNSDSTSVVYLALDSASAGRVPGSSFRANSTAKLSFIVPISQFAGSPNYAGQNETLYYSYPTTGTYSIGTTNTATPIQGNAGSKIPNITTQDTTNGTTDFLFLPSGVLQDGDKWSVEVKLGGIWYDGEKVYPANQQGSASYGLKPYTDTGRLFIGFGRAGATAPTTLSAVSSASWAGLSTNDIRVRVQKGGAAVGFGHATTTASGLVSTGTQSFAGEKTFTTGIVLPTSGGTAAQLNYYEESTFTATLTGCTSNPSVTAKFVRIGKFVQIYIPSNTCTSNSTSATITGMPTRIYPTSAEVMTLGRTVDASVSAVSEFRISTSGVITFFKDIASNNFTASGLKGHGGLSLVYNLN